MLCKDWTWDFGRLRCVGGGEKRYPQGTPRPAKRDDWVPSEKRKRKRKRKLDTIACFQSVCQSVCLSLKLASETQTQAESRWKMEDEGVDENFSHQDDRVQDDITEG